MSTQFEVSGAEKDSFHAGDPDVTDAVDGDTIRSLARAEQPLVRQSPTLTHGEMKLGAGVVAAQKFGAGELVIPRIKFHLLFHQHGHLIQSP